MKTSPVSPRAPARLPHDSSGAESAAAATASTATPLGEAVAGLGFGDEHRLATFLDRIDELDSGHGPDVMRNDINAVLVDIRSEPEDGVSTLLLRLITKLDDWAGSPNPNISGVAAERLLGCLDMLKVCSESCGAPQLQELVRALERTQRDTQFASPRPHRNELHTWMRETAVPMIEGRLAALGLPSAHEGADPELEYEALPTDFDEEDCTPWQREVLQTAQAAEAFGLSDVFNRTLGGLISQAQGGLECRNQIYDLACLNEFRRDPSQEDRVSG